MGREVGYQPSQESKLKSSVNHPKCQKIMAPDGTIYHSHRAAARALNVRHAAIAYFLRIGELQRKGEHLTTKKSGLPLTDYTGWKLIEDTDE